MFREFCIEDSACLVRMLNDGEVSKWTTNIPFPYTHKHALAWLKRRTVDGRDALAIEFNGQLVGCISYWEYDSETTEIGYWIGKEYWGQGIATQALQNLFRLSSFPKKKHIVAKVATQNIASQRVLEKCNFKMLEQSIVYQQNLVLSAFVYSREVG